MEKVIQEKSNSIALLQSAIESVQVRVLFLKCFSVQCKVFLGYRIVQFIEVLNHEATVWFPWYGK